MSSESLKRLRVGVLGASGLVGQALVRTLRQDPSFEVVWLGASKKRVGQSPVSILGSEGEGLPAFEAMLPVPDRAAELQMVFSALPSGVARDVEAAWAEHTIVVSNASAYREDPLVPLVIPEINAHHIAPLLRRQQSERGWKGLITNPNCVAIPLTMALAPWKDLGLERACVTSFQALSGAGRDGPRALESLDNILPDIPGEAPKIASEPLKILGEPEEPLEGLTFSVATARVPVRVGHLLHVRVQLRENSTSEGLLARWRDGHGLRPLPACSKPLVVLEQAPRPADLQPDDMAVYVGGLQVDPLFSWQFWALADNIARGAAGAAWLNGHQIAYDLGS